MYASNQGIIVSLFYHDKVCFTMIKYNGYNHLVNHFKLVIKSQR